MGFEREGGSDKENVRVYVRILGSETLMNDQSITYHQCPLETRT